VAKNKAYEIAVLLTAQDKMSRQITGAVNKSARQLEFLERRATRFGKSAIQAGIVAGGALAYPAKKAAEFEALMANVETLVDSNVENMGLMKNEILAISEQIPKPINDIAEALYSVRSAGIDASKGIDFTRQSGRLAVAGLSTTAESVNIMTSAYNAFKKEGLEAEQIADILFKTVKAGKTTISELSNGFGANASIIESAKIRLADYQAATAALTTTGLPAAQAQSGIRAAIVSLLKPTAEMEKIFESLGVKTGPELIKKSGSLGKTFENVVNTAKKLGIEVVKAGGRVEGAAVITSIAGANNEVYTQTLYDMIKGQNALDEAFEKQVKTAKAQAQIVKNQFTAMAIDIGTVVNPILINVARDIKPIVSQIRNWIQQNPKLTERIIKVSMALATTMVVAGSVSFAFGKLMGISAGLIRTFGTIAKVSSFLFSGFGQGIMVMMRTGSVIKGITAAMRALNLAFLANPIGIAIGAGIALGIVFDQLWKKSETFRGVLLGSWEVVKGFGNILKTFVIDRITGIIKGLGLVGKAIHQLFKGDFKGAAQSALSSFKNVTGIQAVQNAVQSGKGLGEKYGLGYRMGKMQVQTLKQMEGSSAPVMEKSGDVGSLNNSTRQEINYNPTISISGPVSQAQEQAFRDQLLKHKQDIMDIVNRAMANNQRVSQLGSIVFIGTSGFSSFSKTQESSYSKHNRILRKPSIQRTGDKLDIINLGIHLNYAFTNPQERIQELEEAKASNESLPLILGTGEIVGSFVIQRIIQNSNKLDVDGNIIDANIDIELLESFVTSEQREALVNAFAISSNNPIISNAEDTLFGGSDAANDFNNGKSQTREINKYVEFAEKVTSKTKHFLFKAKNLSSFVQANLLNFKNKVDGAGDQYDNFAEMSSQAQDVINKASDLEIAATNENLEQAIIANSSLQSSIETLNNASVPFISQVGTRSI